MSWKKYFKPVNSVLPAENKNNTTGSSSSVSKFNSWLPEVYSGPADRMQRYRVYEQMNLDHEISAALDTIADFGTGADEVTSMPFVVKYNDEPTDAELTVINKSLSQWVRLNELNKRMWRIFRSTLQYGDQFFLRDPESYRLYWVDPGKIEKVMVNESEGKKIETYYIKDVDLNIGSLVASNNLNKVSATQYGTNSLMSAPPLSAGIGYVSGGASLGSATKGAASTIVDAEHVLQITLSDGMNVSWPFGVSILETIYKVYKQKELLEDAILIYRVHRAPERRVFYIDTGNIPPSKSAQYLERIKYEVQQKRIPSRTGGGSNVTDATYNPLSTLEDYYFAVTSDGRGSKVEVLPGGDNLGSIDDLKYFNNKMMRALGVPSSYLPTGPDDGTSTVSDGRVGTAFIQEFRFSKVVSRYQQSIIKPLDTEFKLFLKHRGVTIDSSLFQLEMTEPQSFSEYRQLELDAAKINLYTALAEVPYISKRYALKRYLGWSESELAENELMWREEKSRLSRKFSDPAATTASAPSQLSDIGITTSGIDSLPTDNGDENQDFGDADFSDTGLDNQSDTDLNSGENSL